MSMREREEVQEVLFIQDLMRLEKDSGLDAALDLLYDTIDEMLIARQFTKIDELLDDIVRVGPSYDLCLGILIATLPARHKLENRIKIYCQLEKAGSDAGLYGL